MYHAVHMCGTWLPPYCLKMKRDILNNKYILDYGFTQNVLIQKGLILFKLTYTSNIEIKRRDNYLVILINTIIATWYIADLYIFKTEVNTICIHMRQMCSVSL